MKSEWTSSLVFLALALRLTCAASGARTQNLAIGPPPPLYVDIDAAGANNGSSWADAFTSIQAAIDAAATEGGDVWVAGGTYFDAITLPSEVRLYGGYAGSGDTRNIAAYPTIIDASTSGAGGGPAYHAVTLVESGWDNRLDGLTITGGNAAGTGEDSNGGGLYCFLADCDLENFCLC